MQETLPDREPTPAEPRVRGDAGSRRPALTMALIIGLPAIVLALTGAARYLNGHSTIDLLVFDQGIWALSRGHAPWSSVIQETLLEDHFSPGLLGFAVLYRIVATPIWLIAGQAAAAAGAAWLIARRLMPALGAARAGAVGAALLASPPVAYALLFDVHTIVLAVPFAVAAVLALEDGAPRRALVFGLLAAVFRVEVGVAVAAAVAVWPGPRRGRLFAGLILGAYLAVALYFEKALGHDVYWPIHYGHLGDSPTDALLHPWRVIGRLVSPSSFAKALPWLATGAFLALRRPRLLVPAGILAVPVLLSRWPGAGGIVYQYGAAPTFLLALAWLPALLQRPQRATLVLAGSLGLSAVLGPFIPGVGADNPKQGFLGQYWTPIPELACVGTGIPEEAVVAGTQPIVRLAHRRGLYLWPYPFGPAPPTHLPADYLARPDERRAAEVDYLVLPQEEADAVPAGFVPDGGGERYLRYRRAATTVAQPVTCGPDA